MKRTLVRSASIAVILVIIGFTLGWKLSQRSSTPKVILAPATQGSELVRFLAVGRQGYGTPSTRKLSAAMERAAARSTTYFAILGGDNFHPHGVESVNDSQWKTKFENQYNGAHLRGMPFYAVLGNHDYEGNPQPEIDYTTAGLGSGRWQMNDLYYYKDFGNAPDGRVLVRIAFMDMMAMLDVEAVKRYEHLVPSRDEQIEFLKTTVDAPGDPVWKVIVGHNPLRTLAKREAAVARTMTDLLPIAQSLDIDMVVSSNDWFQQLLDYPDEPLHVSTSGGPPEDRFEPVPFRNSDGIYTKTQQGFAQISIEPGLLQVDLLNINGDVSYTATRSKE